MLRSRPSWPFVLLLLVVLVFVLNAAVSAMRGTLFDHEQPPSTVHIEEAP